MGRSTRSNGWLKLLSLLLILAFLAAACAPPAQPPVAAPAGEPAPEGEPTPEPEPEPAAPSGPSGTLTMASAEQPEFLDPTMSLQILNWTISFQMFDTLVKINDEGEIVPSLAESWELLSPTSWQFTLRDDVTFHDGEPFTCEDVKATLDHITDPEVGARQVAIWALYDSTDCPDDYTAVVNTKEPMGTMLSSLSLTTMIPAHALDTLLENPIGTGPFKFVEWIKDDRLVLEANPDYWGGAPKLERLVFRTIPELATRMSALEQGEVDLVDVVPPEEYERLEGAGIEIARQPTTYLRFIWLNTEVPPLDNLQVREAINLAIDRDAIINDLFQGEAYEVTGVVAPGVVGYCEMPALEFDVEKAKALMAEAGVETPVSIEYKTAEYLAKQKEMAEVIAAYLAEIGINLDIVIQDQALWVKDLLALEWEAEQIGTSTLTGDADYTLRRLYHTDSNRVTYSNPELDRLLIEQLAETDGEKRQQLFCEAAQILWEDVPIVFLFGTIQAYGLNPKVEGFTTRPSQFLYFNDVSVAE